MLGHFGVGLAAKAVCPKLKLPVLVGLAFLPDLLLWPLIAVGIESASVPENYAACRHLNFSFPYSHGLISVLAMSALAAFFTTRLLSRGFGAAAAILVSSHWVLDWMVHSTVFPLGLGQMGVVGLGLGEVVGQALVSEVALVAVGLIALTRPMPVRAKLYSIVLVSVVVGLATLAQLLSPPPPSDAMKLVALSSWGILWLLIGISGLLERLTSKPTC